MLSYSTHQQLQKVWNEERESESEVVTAAAACHNQWCQLIWLSGWQWLYGRKWKEKKTQNKPFN